MVSPIAQKGDTKRRKGRGRGVPSGPFLATTSLALGKFEKVLHVKGPEAPRGNTENASNNLSKEQSQSYRDTKLLLPGGMDCESRSYSEINQHPRLPRNFTTLGVGLPHLLGDIKGRLGQFLEFFSLSLNWSVTTRLQSALLNFKQF